MRVPKSLVAAIMALGCGVVFGAMPASAYVACNRAGDCWHTGSKTLDWSGVILTYHDDDWWDAHKGDAQYRLHEADAQHDWQRGYWRDGKWHGGF